MEEAKSSFPSNVTDQEMEVGECSSEGEDEGEGDDEEEDEEELDEESVDDESEEDIADEEDTVDDSVSLTSENFSEGVSPRQTPTTPCESPFSSMLLIINSCALHLGTRVNSSTFRVRLPRTRVSALRRDK